MIKVIIWSKDGFEVGVILPDRIYIQNKTKQIYHSLTMEQLITKLIKKK
jgi:hypothetical protein